MNLVNQFGGLIGLLALIIGAGVYLFGTAKRGRQDVIRQDNADLRASNQEMRTEKAGLEASVKEKEETIRGLRDIATQTPAVTKLIEMNTKQQTQLNIQHGQVIKQLSGLTGEISKLATQFANLAKVMNSEIKAKR